MAAGAVVIETPPWILGLRISQIVLAVIILGISVNGIYWISFGAWGFALFMSFATFIIAIYNLTTQMVRSWRGAYNYWAILALDIFGVLFWLSAMADLAATRGLFVIPTVIDSCEHESGGGVCNRGKARSLSPLLKRNYVASDAYLASMSAAAGLAAIEMIFFAITLTIFGIHLNRYRASRTNTSQPEYKLESGGLVNSNGGGGTSYSPLAQPQQQYVAPQQYEQYRSQPPQQEQYWGPSQGQYQQALPQQQQTYQ